MAAATIGPSLARGTAISSDVHSTGISDNLSGTGDSLFAGMFEAAAGTGTQTATDATVLADGKTKIPATQTLLAGTFDKAPDLSRGSLQQTTSAVETVPHSAETSAASAPTTSQTVTAPQGASAVSDVVPQPMGSIPDVEAPQADPKNAVGTMAAQELPVPVAQDRSQPADTKLLPQAPHESDAEPVSQSENASPVSDSDKGKTSDTEPAVAVAVKPNASAPPIPVQPAPVTKDAPAQSEIPAQANTAVQATPDQQATSTRETVPQPQVPSQTQESKAGTGTLPLVMPRGHQYAYQPIVRAIDIGSGSDVSQTAALVKADSPKGQISTDTKEDVPQVPSSSDEKNDAQDNGQDGSLVAAVIVPAMPAELAGGEPTKVGKDALSSSESHSTVRGSSKGSVSGKISHRETGNNVAPQQQIIQSDAAVNAMPMTSAAPTVQKQEQGDSVEGPLQSVVAVKTVTTKAVAGKFGRPVQVAERQKTATAKDEKSAKDEAGVTKTLQDVSAPAEKNTSAPEAAAPQVAHSPAVHTVDNKLHTVSALKVETGFNNLQDLANASKPPQSASHDPFARLDAAAGSNAQESGAQWVAAGHRQIEVAIADETHGVMHVRAEKGSDNTVQAVVMASSEVSHEVLKAEAPHMTSFLSQQTVPVDRVQVVRMQESAAMNMDLGGRAQQDRGQQSSGTDAGAEQKKLVWRQVGASPSLSTSSRGLGLLSVRV
ncbi:hypothetical protein FTW19_15905 [Terriglobus albidus]|uniref:Uncharacterized protein n=1 Tax=Terriglobus albidus TaxID=1592106 RepID=A0A5B9EE01_9BACT|nr:hypothetical protein [Terriglobus albidus]QEE29345.1 hypothetical protein FTW19_15905 [Terriglobus albidus]